MVRKELMRRRIGESAVFRLRGEQVSRLEGFSDAVFDFAMTLLVVTLQPPQTYNDLLKVVQGLGAFALSFAMLVFVWFNHYRFFRRYGLEDDVTSLLNIILLFVVLFYVYPLRFIFTFVILAFTAPARAAQLITDNQIPGLYLMYGAGVMAVFLLFALLNAHAYRQRAALDLSVHEAFETLSTIGANLIVVGVALVSVILGETGVGFSWGLPGIIYVVITPVMIVFERIRRRQWRALETTIPVASTPAEHAAPPA